MTEANDRGIWVGTSDALQLVARTNAGAPGLGEGVIFSGLSDLAFDSNGRLQFQVGLLERASLRQTTKRSGPEVQKHWASSCEQAIPVPGSTRM